MKRRTLLHSKIHRATVTGADLTYEGSISICPRLLEAARIVEFEQVDVYNCNNGARLTTYAIEGKEGEICLNGAAARHVQPGDLVIIAAFVEVDEEEIHQHQPRLILVDEKNQPKAIAPGRSDRGSL